jgi:4-alpha-glucanotransferase
MLVMANLVRAALETLGVRRFLIAIHDVSFPVDADEDVGRGSPYSVASERFLAFVASLGFNGIQLGPQGQTSGDNPSPYDGTFFSRNVDSLPVRAFRGIVADERIAAAIAKATARADHARAHAALHGLLAAVPETPALVPRVDGFAMTNGEWLMRDGLYDALRTSFGGIGFRDWPAHNDRAFWARDPSALIQRFAPHLRRYALGQTLAHAEHARFRARAAALGIALYGDLQVGSSDADAWGRAAAFLPDWVMGAPPSRTNPEGQPWGYGVLDPNAPEAAFFDLRIAKAFEEYDGLRIDHPHGIVCPWVYRPGTADPEAAVRAGSRLYESPDLPDLARYAISREEQLDASVPRFADEWVVDLDPAQIDRYAIHFDAIVAAAKKAGREPNSLACEVLSTAPHPLRSVLERHGLGRFRVTQKADLDNPKDGYRSENAETPDWAMIGNHDTPPLFALVHKWDADRRAKWAAYLAPRLRISTAELRTPYELAQALLADLFLCPAENVCVFFGDLFGYTDSFNVPGLVHPDNWTLRLPSDFDAFYTQRVAAKEALDIEAALTMALSARKLRG